MFEFIYQLTRDQSVFILAHKPLKTLIQESSSEESGIPLFFAPPQAYKDAVVCRYYYCACDTARRHLSDLKYRPTDSGTIVYKPTLMRSKNVFLDDCKFTHDNVTLVITEEHHTY